MTKHHNDHRSMRASPTQWSCLHTLFFVGVTAWLMSSVAYAAPTISLSARIGPPTTKFTVSGSGFEPNATVDIYFDKQGEGRTVTNGQGAFYRVAIQVPDSSYSGKHWVTALERDQKIGGQKPFLVYTNWPEYGFDPTLSGVNPYENFLNRSNVSQLQPLWTFTLHAGSYSFSTPAIYNGLVYAGFFSGGGGDHSGLYVLDGATGDNAWTYWSPSASPAIQNGVLYSHDGQAVSALDARNGILIWRYFMLDGGAFFSGPALADGKVFIASGLVYALDQKTGSFLWSFQADGEESFYFPAAVANGSVYACSTAYFNNVSTCYALNEKTGSLLWKYHLQTLTQVAPTVADGLVFFGADQVYALDAVSGTLVWSYNHSSGSSASVYNGTVYIVTEDGLSALDASSGTLLWTNASVDQGKPAIANDVVYMDSSGTLFAIDAESGTTLWSYEVGNNLGGNNYVGVVVANGKVFATTFSNSPLVGQVYAFGVSNQSSPKSVSPPDFSLLKPSTR